MATRNDITGDALISRTSRAYKDNFDQIQKDTSEDPVFKIHECPNCHIKISTSNNRCPCCGNELT